MLVLDRKSNESVKLYADQPAEITIHVTVENGKAKLAIDAPRHVAIWRTELLIDGKRPEKKDVGVPAKTG